MRILMIEDDNSIVNFLEPLLKNEGYELFHAETIEQSEIIMRTYPIDLLLLDLGLPDKDGLVFLSDFKESQQIPIIVISARSDESTKVTALDLNADDYLTKPFGSNELLARIRTAKKHYQKRETENLKILVNGPLVLNIEKHEVFINEKIIHLTKNEFLLLEVMMKNIGKVLTHDHLAKSVWGLGSMNSLTLRVNMSNLRKKIEQNPIDPQFIHTEIGVGYRLLEILI